MDAPVVRSIVTGTPPVRKSQEEALRFMQRVEGLPDRIADRLPALYEHTGIAYRHTGLEDYDREASEFEFFPPNWSLEPAPGTRARNEKYREIVRPLAVRLARGALDQSGVPADSITHVITVTCTGFYAPGLDVELVEALDLPPTVGRTMIGFMGCHAAFNALRTADALCRSRPGARVLVVCAELCTLHFQIEDTLESAVINALFSDGAAAAIVTGESPSGGAPTWRYVHEGSRILEDSREAMSWTIGDEGFLMGLDPSVADRVAEHLPAFTDALLEEAGVDRAEVDFWAVHPGGPRVLERVAGALDLEEGRLSESRAVLREYGNMSSPTVLFVLERCFEARSGRYGVALGFGPGLTVQGAVFRRDESAHSDSGAG